MNIINKVVVSKRGGYCFEHNKLIYEALVDVGFGYASSNTLVKFKGETTTSLGRTYRIEKRSDSSYALQLVLDDEVRSLVNGNYQKIFADKKRLIKINSAKELEDILRKEFEYPIKDDEVKKLYDSFIAHTN